MEELCSLVSIEKDPQKLLELTREINQLLLKQEQRLRAPKPPIDEKR